jgi:hypothetical protein
VGRTEARGGRERGSEGSDAVGGRLELDPGRGGSGREKLNAGAKGRKDCDCAGAVEVAAVVVDEAEGARKDWPGSRKEWLFAARGAERSECCWLW